MWCAIPSFRSQKQITEEAVEGDIAAVLSLYTPAEADEMADDRALRAASWDILTDPRTHLFLLEYGGVPVSTCVLHILPNLTRGAKEGLIVYPPG